MVLVGVKSAAEILGKVASPSHKIIAHQSCSLYRRDEAGGVCMLVPCTYLSCNRKVQKWFILNIVGSSSLYIQEPC